MADDSQIFDGYRRNARFWIRIIRERRDKYQVELTDPALLDMIGSCAGRRVLDAGCGEGYLTRELLRRGAAQIHAVDTCRELVDAAERHPEAGGGRATYHHADVADLPVPDASVDLVVANRLPHGVAAPERRFREFSRVLTDSGRLVILGMHPCFYASRTDRARGVGPSADSYFRVRTVEQHFTVDGLVSPAPSWQQFHSLEAYITMITDAGFTVSALREPHPTERQRSSDPWWNENFTRPMFLLLECLRRRSGTDTSHH
ncbi:class I SAM-dependent methyltransferase [Nocardia brevicatena]|uniref:class I SAM-dependent methyltransferase n=1 Tax=Nocardia brevicatena TaxID=37327 RepID=UPI000310BB3D|nr:class I SAM-dependent methyltransferase [Nocardia brevicatena]